MRRVEVAQAVLHIAHQRFGDEWSPQGQVSEYDFVGGPLAALREQHRRRPTLIAMLDKAGLG